MAAAMNNTVVTTDLTAVREVDFVSRFTREIKILRDILGSVRMEKHEAGTVLKSKSAAVTLNASAVGEGEVIPYNEVTYTDTPVGTLTWDKQRIGISLETISKSGYDAAVQQADDDMLYKLRGNIVSRFMTFIKTGTLTTEETITDFQMAVAEAIGQVQNKWEDMDKGYSGIIGFANTLDAYRYLGAANISTQTAFGMSYLENFLGFNKLFLTSKIESGKVIATPSENIIIYHADVTDSDFTKAGFQFRTDGEDNLIGVHVDGNHNTDVSELSTISGIGIFAEYLDGIAVINIGTPTPKVTLDKSTATVEEDGTVSLAATTTPAGETVTWTSSNTSAATVANGVVTGVAEGTATITASITVDGETYTATCAVTVTAKSA